MFNTIDNFSLHKRKKNKINKNPFLFKVILPPFKHKVGGNDSSYSCKICSVVFNRRDNLSSYKAATDE